VPELAIAFVLQHPTSRRRFIGPRTVEQVTSLLHAAELALDDELLDRIDAIVPPGTTINPADDNHLAPEGLADVSLRRRSRSSA